MLPQCVKSQALAMALNQLRNLLKKLTDANERDLGAALLSELAEKHEETKKAQEETKTAQEETKAAQAKLVGSLEARRCRCHVCFLRVEC